jgi:uncharacterized protein YhaN
MTRHFGVETLSQVALQLDQIASRDRLVQEVAQVQQQILTTLSFATLPEAEAALDAADQGALQKELSTLTEQAQTLELAWRDSHSEHREAQRQIDLIGGDARVAQLEEQRRTVLLEIEERALSYLRLKAGTLATEQALRLYRERHRGSMLERASEALHVMSRGAYTRLSTQPDGDAEVLVAQASDGSSKLVAQMSKGTRFQLYLALRVAGYLEIARTRSPVPFVADDIMETFDDFRAEETLKLFTEVARTGQVIYLTHHRHLCDLARQACPTVSIHDLSAVTTAPGLLALDHAAN